MEVDLVPTRFVAVPPPLADLDPRKEAALGGMERPWSYPTGFPRVNVPHGGCTMAPSVESMGPGLCIADDGRIQPPRNIRLRSFLSSWTDIAGDDAGAGSSPPLVSGSLVTMNYSAAGGPRDWGQGMMMTYTLIIREIQDQILGGGCSDRNSRATMTGDHYGAPAFIFADDLPFLLLHSIPDLDEPDRDRQKPKEGKNTRLTHRRVIQVPIREHVLNLVPAFSVPQGEVVPAVSNAISHVSRCLRLSLPDALYARMLCADGLAITGEEGMGKTHCLVSVAAYLRLHGSCATVYLDCGNLQRSSSSNGFGMGGILDALSTAFREAALCQPSVLLLDDLDSLVPNVSSSSKDNDGGSIQHQQINPVLVGQVKVIMDHIRYLMDEWLCLPDFATHNMELKSQKGKRVAVVCTCRDKNSLHPSLRSIGFFSSAVAVPNFDGN